MLQEIRKHLRPVRSRLTIRRALRALAGAFVLGGWVALVAGLLALFGGGTAPAIAGLAVLVLFPLAAAAVYFRPATWRQAARAVDRHFHLHDRTATALYLAEHPSGDPLEGLQIEDALAYLRQVNPREAAKSAAPWQRMAGGLVLCAFALLLIGWASLAPLAAMSPRGGSAYEDRREEPRRPAAAAVAVDQQLARRSAALGGNSLDDETFAPPAAADSGLANRYFDAIQPGEAAAPAAGQ